MIRPKPKHSFIFVYALLLGIGTFSVGYGAYGAGQGSPIIRDHYRPVIENRLPLSDVQANFDDQPNVNGPLSELPSYNCQGWNQDTDPSHPDPGSWVVILCTR